jgi:hypothetical protein
MMDEHFKVAGATIVSFRALRSRSSGDDSFIIGSVEFGQFIEVPAVAVEVIDLLSRGHTVDQVQSRLRSEHGTDVDVAGFVEDLVELGFVTAMDGREVAQEPPPPVSLGWVQPKHVSWLLKRRSFVGFGALLAIAAAVLITHPWLMPSYHDLVWDRFGGLVLAGNTAAIWSIIYLHELGHLLTARAAGVPGRIMLSTRLQFLVAQTDVSGVWVEPRRVRVAVYLAGMAVNLGLAALGVLVRAGAAVNSALYHAAGVVVLLALLLLVPQAAVFMRTDLYFLLQDLSGCGNLYSDSVAFLRSRLRRLCGRAGGVPDPSVALSTRERRAVCGYSVLLVLGTAAALLAAITVTYPALILLLTRALRTLAASGEPVLLADAAATVTVVVLLQALWLLAWWRRHGRRLTAPTLDGDERR